MVGLALVVALGFAAPASEAALFNLTTDPRAENPDIAVDDSGTSHIAWNVSAGVPGDDRLFYCRMPRGRKACDLTHTISLPGTDFRGPQVILTRSGEVVLISPREAFPGTRVYAVTSADGGAGFSSPRVISERFYGAGQEAALGPGDFSISLAGGFGGGNEGVIYQAAPLDATTASAADLTGGDWTKAFDVSVGFPDPLTPLVAYSGGPSGQPTRMYFRRWDGSGDFNDPANWESEKAIPGTGSETKLASGLRGVYLIYRGEEPPYQYFVRRFDGQNFPAASQRVVSDPRTGGSAIFRDFLEDDGGNLHAVFRQRSGKGISGLRHRTSRDGGKRWDPVEVLAGGAAVDDLFNLRVGAGADGGGGVVGDHNGKGPVWFSPFGRLTGARGGGGACAPTVKLGKSIARALQGCFRRQGKRWIAAGPVKLNGVDIEPAAGAGATAAAAFRVTAAPGPRTLRTNRKADVRVGKVLLEKGVVAWRLPSGNGKVTRIGSADGSVFRDLGKFAKTLFEFPVDGDAELFISGGGTKVPIHLRMPPLMDGVTGNTMLRTDADGQVLEGIKIKVPTAAIGLLHIVGVDVTYDGADRFTGNARFRLPPAYASKPQLAVTFAFLKGELDRAEADLPFDPSLPILGAPPNPIIGLHRIGFVYEKKPGSRRFTGEIGLSGPTVGPGLRSAELDGSVYLEFPDGSPATIGAKGDLEVVSVPFANGGVTYRTDGLFSFSGGFEFPPPGLWQELARIDGSVAGKVDLDNRRFNAEGSAHASILGFGFNGETIFSSKGFAGCAELLPLPPGVPKPPGVPTEYGLQYRWGDTLPTLFCDISELRVQISGASASQSSPVKLPAKLPHAVIAVEGQEDAPAVTVTAPDGQQVSSGEEIITSGPFTAIPFAAAKTTYVRIEKPAAGAYRVESRSGSTPIAQVRTARGLPQPSVKAKVRGRGRKRLLSYRVRPLAGQRVIFAEENAGGLYRELGVARGRRGRLSFRPAWTSGRRRQIVALVEQDGVPRAKLNIARYKAPPSRLRRPRRVSARRRGGRLLVGWTRVRAARGYEVRVNLPRDGRRLLFFVKRKQRRLRVKGIERSDLGRITVAAIGPDLRTGRAGKAKLKPKTRKRKRRGGRRRSGRGRGR